MIADPAEIVFKIPQWLKVIAEVCGGWWAAMSGAVSVPLALLALFCEGSPRLYFAVLAYFGMWVFAVGVVIRNKKDKAATDLELQRVIATHAKEKEQIVSLGVEQTKALQDEIQSL